MAISRFDDGALGSALIGYWSGVESTINKTGSTVDSVLPAYPVSAPTLTPRTAGQVFHDGTTQIGSAGLLAFNNDYASDTRGSLHAASLDIPLNNGLTAVTVTTYKGNSTTGKSMVLRAGASNMVMIEPRNTNIYRVRINGTDISTSVVRRFNEPTIEFMHYSTSANSLTIDIKNDTESVSETTTHASPAMTNADMLMWMGGNESNQAIKGDSAIFVLYNRQLTSQEILDVRELCQYWIDNGEAPSTGPTSGQFGPVTTNKDGEVTTWQWEESSDGTNWGNVGTILTDTTGANTNTLTVNSATLGMHNTQVRCQADTGSQQATSDPATLTVLSQATGLPPPADITEYSEIAGLWAAWDTDVETWTEQSDPSPMSYVVFDGTTNELTSVSPIYGDATGELRMFPYGAAPVMHDNRGIVIDTMRALRVSSSSGVNGGVRYAYPTPYNPSGGMTVVVIETRDYATDTGYSFAVQRSNGTQYLAIVGDSGNYAFVDGAGPAQDTGVAIVPADSRVIAVTFSGGVADSATVYVDGQAANSVTLASQSDTVSHVSIMNSALDGATNNMVGNNCTLLIYHRALTSDEIVSITNCARNKLITGGARWW